MPDDPALAGEPLAVALMNTVWADRAGLHDALTSTASALAWADAIADRTDLPAGRPADADRLRSGLHRLRDALRLLAAAETGDPRGAGTPTPTDVQRAIRHLNQAAAAGPRWSALSWPAGSEPTRTVHAAGPAGCSLVAAIAEQAIALFSGDQRQRLRACLAPGCVRYFSKTHPRREWCCRSCGNRARVARHYRRHRGSSAPTGTRPARARR